MGPHTRPELQNWSRALRLGFPIQIRQFHLTHSKVTGSTYFTLVINTIAIDVHIGNPDKGSTLFLLLIVVRLKISENFEVNVPR